MKWPFQKKHNEQQARDKPTKQRKQMLNLRSINRPRADRTIEGNEAIYAAVSRIANTMASMPMHLYKGYEIAKSHPLERLINLEPHPNFSAFTWRQTMEVLRNTEGNAYALIVRDKMGQITRLDILNPTRVQPARDPTDGSDWYIITLDDGQPYQVPGFMVLNIRHMSANGVKGIRPIDVLRRSLDYDAQVKDLALDQLDGVNHGIMLTVPNTGLDQDAKDELVDRFLETYQQSGRSVVVLEGGLTATSFSADAVDAHLLDVERITRNKVAAVYNLPPHMLGDYSQGNKSTTEQQLLEFLQLTIMPIVEQWEEECNRRLLTPQDYTAGYRVRFDTSALVRADIATMAQKYQIAIRGGWMKPNEVREKEGQPPDPNGNELMSSRDLIPIRIAVQTPELLLGGAAAASTPAEPGAGEKGSES